MVEQIVGDAELVILPLSEGVAAEGSYEGAAIHSGGELILVRRPDWLIEQGGKLKALVVDDSLTARAMHRGISGSGGYMVHASYLAKQALKMLEGGTYDVIMDGMDSLELTRALKSGPQPLVTPVVLVSANDAESDRAAALASGARENLMAPIRVLIADDSVTMRAALMGLLRQDPEIEVVGSAKNGDEAVALAGPLAPDVQCRAWTGLKRPT